MSKLEGPTKRSRHLFVSEPRATASSTNGVRSDTNLPLAVMVSVAAFPMNVLPFNVVTPAETSVPEEASVSLAWIVPATSTACSGAVVPIPSRLLNWSQKKFALSSFSSPPVPVNTTDPVSNPMVTPCV